jgi:hypothetical protein
MTFVLLDISGVAWGPYSSELGLSFNTLNDSTALNYAGLAFGCVLFIPLVYKFGRRPLYILSLLVQLASAIWSAKLNTGGEMLAVSLVSGLGGAISETIVQITIADMFFVHQHATMNSIFLLMQSAGAYLGPVAAGYVVISSQGWRWMWWWTAILLGLNLIAVIFGFEESKYVPKIYGQGIEILPDSGDATESSKQINEESSTGKRTAVNEPLSEGFFYLPKSYRQRMAFVTRSETGTLEAPYLKHMIRPVIILITFPVVTYAAITYGALLSWYSVVVTVEANYLLYPPYNFDAAAVGLLNLAPFVGCLFGTVLGGPLSDYSIIWLSKRNNGIFEPEMRLWLTLPAVLICPAGLLTFGIGLDRVSPLFIYFVSHC